MSEIQGKNVLIAGFGIEGQSTLKFLKKNYKELKISVTDQKTGGKNYLNNLERYDTVVRSPGIPIELFKKAKNLTSHTNIFFENCPGKIVAVTGTKGKSTTTTLIHKLLRTKFKDVRLTGNIGKPALDSLKKATKDTIFVLEISSFQLEDINYSPHIAVLLAITQDHIDRHGSLKSYVNAKQNLIKFQTKSDYVFYNSKDKTATKIAEKSKAKKFPVTPRKFNFNKNLIGNGNEANVSMAIEIAKHFKVSEDNIKKVVSSFKPLPHRIEKVGTFKGITFYDDSIATNPDASLNGILALKDSLGSVIIGGANKGFNFDSFINEIAKLDIPNIILLPDTGFEMYEDLTKKSKKSNIFKADNMQEAVKLAYEKTGENMSCLLSPAATSFNMYESYKARGDDFAKKVRSQNK